MGDHEKKKGTYACKVKNGEKTPEHVQYLISGVSEASRAMVDSSMMIGWTTIKL